MIAEVSDTVRKSGCGFVRIATREVLGTEIVVTSPIAQHVIDGCENRGGDRDGRLFRPVTRFQAQELGLEIAAFLARCGPGALYQRGLEPGSALLDPCRTAFAGAFVKML